MIAALLAPRRAWLSSSKPLPSGSVRSRITRSARGSSRSASASVATTVVLNPSRRRKKAIDSAIAGSSSTTRTLAMGAEPSG